MAEERFIVPDHVMQLPAASVRHLLLCCRGQLRSTLWFQVSQLSSEWQSASQKTLAKTLLLEERAALLVSLYDYLQSTLNLDLVA